MDNEISAITKSLFQKESPLEVSIASIEEAIAKYPYYAPARLLLAKRSFDSEGEAAEAIITAGLFLHNPLRLDWLLRHEQNTAEDFVHQPAEPIANEDVAGPEPDSLPLEPQAPEPQPFAKHAFPAEHDEQQPDGQYFLENLDEIKPEAEQPAELQEEQSPPLHEQQVRPQPIAEQKAAPPAEDSPITFQSYHTIDYFASQGIRLQQAELAKDKLGQQLKSFTEWLRSMKKLPATESELPAVYDTVRHNSVMQSAAHSIEAREILTEAMAQVWAKQGNNDRAISIYEKLSLQNPAKSDYFAAKIDQLKAL